jgi:hypothetical protein
MTRSPDSTKPSPPPRELEFDHWLALGEARAALNDYVIDKNVAARAAAALERALRGDDDLLTSAQAATVSHRSVNRFSQREVARAVRAVADTGAVVDRVVINPVNGEISVVIAKGGETDVDRQPNPWDEVLTKDANQKRPA